MVDTMDEVFKALADPVRRDLMDRLLTRNELSLIELCEGFSLSRQAVAKHLRVLEQANLVSVRRSGREKIHTLNVEPIQRIYDRWIGKFDRDRVAALADLKRALENGNG